MLYEEFGFSLESTTFQKRPFYKIVKTLKSENGPKGPERGKKPTYDFMQNRVQIVMMDYSFIMQEKINVKFGR